MAKEKYERFERTYVQKTMMECLEVLVDRETGVNYLCRSSAGYIGGMTVLVDRGGKPIITRVDSTR